MFVAIHQYQLSTFFLVISHIPVKAVAEAKASAQGMAPSKKFSFSLLFVFFHPHIPAIKTHDRIIKVHTGFTR